MARNILNNLLEGGYPAIEHRQGSMSMLPVCVYRNLIRVDGRSAADRDGTARERVIAPVDLLDNDVDEER